MRNLLLALAGICLGILGTLALGPGRASSARVPGGEEATAPAPATGELDRYAALQGTLDRIEARLEALEREAASEREVVPTARSEVAERGREDAELDPVLVELRKLRAELDERFEELRGELGPAPALADLKLARPDPDWAELGALIALWSADPEAAKRDVLLLDEAATIERFGAPTSLWGNEDRMVWLYGQGFDPATESYRTEVYLVFRSGHATEIWVELD